MADQIVLPGSPEWWRDRLFAELTSRARDVAKMERYYAGDHPLPTPPQRLPAEAYREAVKAWKSLTEMAVTNWVKLVADAPAARLAVTGFRSGGAQAAEDDEAWAIWQRNHLDADQALVYDNALQTGNSAAIVWADGDGNAVVTVEHSSQVIVAYEPGSRRDRAAALKVWADDSGRLAATLYLPDRLYKWETASTRPGYGMAVEGAPSWRVRQPDGEEWPLPNPLGVVPVIEFRANAGMRPAPFGGGRSEFAGVIPIQDRVNKVTFDQLATMEAQAFRQRWVIGWDPERDPETGLPDPVKMQKASQSLLWTFDADPTELKVGEFGQADFGGFTGAIGDAVEAIAAISQTPPWALGMGKLANAKAETIGAADSLFVAKTRKHRDQFGASWEEVIRLALKIENPERPTDESSMVLWRDIEQHTWGEIVDSLVKLKTIDVPREELWSRVPNATPQDVARWRAQEAVDGLLTPEPTDTPAPVPDAG